MSLFILSDTHFRHKNILKYEPLRGIWGTFASVEDHDAELSRRWNSVVTPQDTVLHLGDVSMGKYDVHHLNGQKILIKGNHDRSTTAMQAAGWDQVWDYLEYQRVVGPHLQVNASPGHEAFGWFFSHQPKPLDADQKLMFNVHGHTHSAELDLPPDQRLRYICVSVERTAGYPLPIEQLYGIMRARACTLRQMPTQGMIWPYGEGNDDTHRHQ